MPASCHTLCQLMLVTVIIFGVSVPASSAENSCSQLTPTGEQNLKLQQDNELLTQKIKQLESVKAIPVERLRRKKALRLKEIAAEVRSQRQSTCDFEGFV